MWGSLVGRSWESLWLPWSKKDISQLKNNRKVSRKSQRSTSNIQSKYMMYSKRGWLVEWCFMTGPSLYRTCKVISPRVHRAYGWMHAPYKTLLLLLSSSSSSFVVRRSSSVGIRHPASGNRQSAIGNRQSAIGNHYHHHLSSHPVYI